MKLRFLKYFCVLAEELHFRRAASRLAISQPPLSAAIRALEEDLGVPLFLRNNRMVQLTPAGIAFLTEAREILERVSRLGNIAQAAGSGLQGRLDIGFTASMLYRDAPSIIDAFMEQAPLVEVVLHEFSAKEQLEKLTRRQLHAGFLLGSTTPATLRSISLKNDVYVLCMPDYHPALKKNGLTLAGLENESFIMFARETAPTNHDNVIAIFNDAKMHPKIVHSARTWTSIVTMVAQGRGLALVPSSMKKAAIKGVSFVSYNGDPTYAPSILAWNPELAPPSLEVLLECARRCYTKPA